MISNPKHGWCNFDLGTFHGTPSYTTDVPMNLLDAFIQYHITGTGIAWLDEEGTWFTFVITPYSRFIIEEKDKSVLYEFSGRIDNLEKELIEDIEKDLTGWAEFIVCSDDEEAIIRAKDRIKDKITALKKINKTEGKICIKN